MHNASDNAQHPGTSSVSLSDYIIDELSKAGLTGRGWG